MEACSYTSLRTSADPILLLTAQFKSQSVSLKAPLTINMQSPFLILTLVCVLTFLVEGFRPLVLPTRLTVSRNLQLNPMQNNSPERLNPFQELINAFIESFPQVLKPPKEMDKTKVINDPPKYLKVST